VCCRYLSWDDYFMSVAFLSAQRSKDPNKQVTHHRCLASCQQSATQRTINLRHAHQGTAKTASKCTGGLLSRLEPALSARIRSYSALATMASLEAALISNFLGPRCHLLATPWKLSMHFCCLTPALCTSLYMSLHMSLCSLS